jgi:hypothetical protein
MGSFDPSPPQVEGAQTRRTNKTGGAVNQNPSILTAVLAVGFLTQAVAAIAQSDIGRDKIACEQGDAQACLRNGVRFQDGDGVPKDATTAIGYYKGGCALGDAGSCYWAGVRIDDDLKQPKEAQQYYDKACSMGESRGCLVAGGKLEMGQDLPQDRARAIEYFKRGCALHNSETCVYAAQVLKSLEKEKESHEYYELACSMGLAIACYNAGLDLFSGSGVEQSWDKAISRMKTACGAGHEKACATLFEEVLGFTALLMSVPLLLAVITWLATQEPKWRHARWPFLWATLGLALGLVGYVLFLHVLLGLPRNGIIVLTGVYCCPVFVAIQRWARKKALGIDAQPQQGAP